MVTLQINGREMTFSKEELTSIAVSKAPYEIAATPTEGKLFRVDPNSIDRKLFEEKRADYYQEKTRQIILDAFAEMDSIPEKYAKVFYTLIPEKNWEKATVIELEKLAEILGHHMAKWIEQALEWAQRITNGERWNTVCNESDTANWFRLVKFHACANWFVGGARNDGSSCYPASDFDLSVSNGLCSNVVPLVVLYEE